MSNLRFIYSKSLLLASIAFSLVFASVGVAQASFGELARFGAPGLNGSHEGEVGKLTPSIRDVGSPRNFDFRPFHVIGVEPRTNDVFVLEEYKEGTLSGPKEELTRFLRLQEFSETGDLLGHHDLEYTGSDEGPESEQTIEGIAIDPEKSRLYFLITEVREKKPEKESNVAAALYAFNTTPNSSKELEPASGTDNGVLAGTEKLLPTSGTASVPLLQPHGITVDPVTHEVVILAHDCIEETEPEQKKHDCSEDELETDEEQNEVATDHYVIQRVKENGELGERFVDTSNVLKQQTGESFLPPTSPVFVGSGASERLFANDIVENTGREDFVDQFPPLASGAATRTQLPDTGGTQGSSFESIGDAGEGIGGALAVSPDGKTLYGVTRIENEEVEGSPEALYGIAERSAETLAPIGWTGGQRSTANDKCALEPGINEGERIQIAAGKEGKIFVLVPEYLREPAEGSFPTKDAIVEFGEGGEGCPQASATAIGATVNGKEITGSLSLKVPVALSTFIKQGDALSTKWTIENEATHTKVEETQSTDQLQHPTLDYEFTAVGKYKITEELQTDNLDTPSLTVTRTGLTVEEPNEPITVTTQPSNVTAVAGTTAKFTASATGKPPPGAPEWYVSHDHGVTFEKDTEDKGALTGTLEVVASASKNGFEYHAVFENQAKTESVTSDNATLTTITEAPAVTTQPANVTVTAGENASFSAAATGGPPPTVQWEVSTDGGTSWTQVSKATTGTLTITGTSAAENGSQYRAVFTNGVGSPADSNAATLTVNPAKGGGIVEGSTTGPGTGGPGTTNPGGGSPATKSVAPAAAITGASAVTVSSSGALSLTVSCPAGATTCIGTVTLRTLSAVSAKASAAKKSKKAILTLATVSFSVAGGQTKTISLHLSSIARKLLSHSHSLAARATVLAHDPAGEQQTTSKTLTLRLAKAKHKH